MFYVRIILKYIQDPLVTRFTRQVQSHSNGMLGEVIMLNVFRRIKVKTIYIGSQCSGSFFTW
jgi:hypothetical protein